MFQRPEKIYNIVITHLRVYPKSDFSFLQSNHFIRQPKKHEMEG